MVKVPAGCFMMGSDTEDAYGDEQPVHEVCLSAFWISQTEVTNAQYRQCVDAGVCESPYTVYERCHYADAGYENHPIVCVNWHQAQAYAEWLGGRLPTEAQWEYAARGPASQVYSWGGVFDGVRLNFCDVNCEYDWRDENWDDGYTETAPVGGYPAGASWVGALDMSGNAWEWAADWYGEHYYATLAPGVLDPTGPADGEYRVTRGGSFANTSRLVRASGRDGLTSSRHLDNRGFRIIASISR
jgi:formylglycine-generating enzyme required for sulfatase activity